MAITNNICSSRADDGKLGSEADTGEFWSLFGGFAPLAKKAATNDTQKEEHVARKLLW